MNINSLEQIPIECRNCPDAGVNWLDRKLGQRAIDKVLEKYQNCGGKEEYMATEPRLGDNGLIVEETLRVSDCPQNITDEMRIKSQTIAARNLADRCFYAGAANYMVGFLER